MSKWSILILLFILSCSKIIDKPKDLLSKDQMAEMMADFAINDQSYLYNKQDNREAETKYIMQHYKISAATFTNSYTYYISTGELDDIVDRAQNVLLKKNPKLEGYIKKNESPKPIENTN